MSEEIVVAETVPVTVVAEEVKEVKPKKEKQPKQPKQPKPQKDQPAAGGKGKAKPADDGFGMSAKKTENFSQWYSQLVTRSELVDYYEISGCYILRPWAYQIWEQIQSFMDSEFKKLGVKNSYFPMFVPKKHLETEKEHVEGFAAEVAWVTHSGNTKLEEPIAVRPTSETIMYPSFSRWIRSHRDLPMRLNQWCNVVRWEFKYPTPFIRSREFLWQEGHTAHAGYETAEKEVLDILDIYYRTYSELLAVEMTKGVKTEHEKFAGGKYSTTVEGYIPVIGRGIQAATSHCLGTNFAKMFNIEYLAHDGQKHHAVQNSWGFTTRSIGVMIMTHSDDKGLVLPPRISPIQAVIIPITFKNSTADLLEKANGLYEQLKALDIRVELDDRDNYNPGWKFSHWELKGVPIRIEIGPKDVEKEQCVVARRDTGEKIVVAWANFGETVKTILDTIQADLFAKASQTHKTSILRAVTWDEFMAAISDRKLAMIPWCKDEDCEKSIKVQSAIDSKPTSDESGDEKGSGEKLTGAAKSLCIPFEQPEEDVTQHKCVKCGEQAKTWVMFGRSY